MNPEQEKEAFYLTLVCVGGLTLLYVAYRVYRRWRLDRLLRAYHPATTTTTPAPVPTELKAPPEAYAASFTLGDIEEVEDEEDDDPIDTIDLEEQQQLKIN